MGAICWRKPDIKTALDVNGIFRRQHRADVSNDLFSFRRCQPGFQVLNRVKPDNDVISTVTCGWTDHIRAQVPCKSATDLANLVEPSLIARLMPSRTTWVTTNVAVPLLAMTASVAITLSAIRMCSCNRLGCSCIQQVSKHVDWLCSDHPVLANADIGYGAHATLLSRKF